MAGKLEFGGRRLPFLRWSFLRLLLGIRGLTKNWQVGDGREDALLERVLERAKTGDLDDVIRTIDDFAYNDSFLINVGDEKGELLDAAIARAQPTLLLELGTYLGYSALRAVRAMPADAHLVSLEFSAANATIARRILEHAGVGQRVTVVNGTLDDGTTMAALEAEHGFGAGAVGFVFLDHAKEAYLPDLERILDRGWLRPGAIVVADNVKFPGVPNYRQYMRDTRVAPGGPPSMRRMRSTRP